MFPKGRIFVNYLQLKQAIDLFFKNWKLVAKSTSKSIRCYYSHTPNKKKNTQFLCEGEDNVRKRNYPAIQIKCPFEIKWSYVDYRKPYQHGLFYKVKISKIVSTEHTCMMSNIGYSQALKSYRGHPKIDLKGATPLVNNLSPLET